MMRWNTKLVQLVGLDNQLRQELVGQRIEVISVKFGSVSSSKIRFYYHISKVTSYN